MCSPRVALLPAALFLTLLGGAISPADLEAQDEACSSTAPGSRPIPCSPQTTFQTNIPGGRYWYDPMSGGWGLAGGPTLGFTIAGLPIGGPLPADISGGTTGVFVNGRQLPVQDLVGLQALAGPVAPGRYFIDQQGNAGFEGGPPMVNLRTLAIQQGVYRQGSGVGENDGDGSGAYHNPRTGIGIITDGGGAAVFTPECAPRRS